MVAGGFRDLLRAGPDSVTSQPGRVSPDFEQQWGELGLAGWKLYTGPLPDGEPFVWAAGRRASLNLPACDARDRTIELRALLPGGGQSELEAELTVKLNDLVLGVQTLTTRPESFSLEAPAALWKAGRNKLVLEIPETLSIETPDGPRAFGVGLAEVSYGTTRQVIVSPGERRLMLEPRTGVGYQLELVGQTELEVRAATGGDGSLEIYWELLDAGLGGPEEGRSLLARFGSTDGLVTGSVPLHEVIAEPEWPLLLTFIWDSEGDEALEFERLGLREPGGLERPPILFISIDTLAARHLSLYGYGRETSPALERFARDAVLFERCATNATWTLPSYLSVMTGLYSRANRRYPLGEDKTGELWELWQLAENRWTMAEMLRAHGYRTGGFVDNGWLTERFHFPQGFEPGGYDWSAGAIPPSDPDNGIRKVLPLAREWLSSLEPQEPFFLFLHAFDVHGPYIPEEGWDGAFDGDGLYDPEHTAPVLPYTKNFGVVPEYIARAEFPEPEPLPELIHTSPLAGDYDEGVLAIDHELGAFFDWLREEGVYDRALIVVTADHGETDVRHDYYFGHGVLWEEVVQVPLLVKLPGNQSAGARVSNSVQLVDLYPTFQDFAGLPPRLGLHGRSLMPLLRGEAALNLPTFSEEGVMRQSAIELNGWKLLEFRAADEIAVETLFSWPRLDQEWLHETFPELQGGHLTPERLVWIVQRRHPDEILRLLRAQAREPRYSLYYLGDDPLEENDLYRPDHPKLEPLLQGLRALQSLSERARGHARPDDEFREFSAQELEDLRALGYVGDERGAGH